MSDEFGNVPPQPGEPAVEQPWGTPVQTGYQQVPPPGSVPPAGYPPPSGYPPPAGYAPTASSGLSDSSAGAIAYLTFIPAVIFLVIDPYKNKPFVKFHSIQSIGLTLAWIAIEIVLGVLSVALAFVPGLHLLGLLLYPLAGLAIFIVWLLCILKAGQGGSFKLPVIGDAAEKQAGA